MEGMAYDKDTTKNILRALLEKKQAEEQGTKVEGHNAKLIAEKVDSSIDYTRKLLKPLRVAGYIKVYRGYYNITEKGEELLKSDKPVILTTDVVKENILIVPTRLLKTSEYFFAMRKQADVAKTYPNLPDTLITEFVVPLLTIYCLQKDIDLPDIEGEYSTPNVQRIHNTIIDIIKTHILE